MGKEKRPKSRGAEVKRSRGEQRYNFRSSAPLLLCYRPHALLSAFLSRLDSNVTCLTQ